MKSQQTPETKRRKEFTKRKQKQNETKQTDVLNTNHNNHTKQCESERSNKRVLKLEPVINTNKLSVHVHV